MPRRYVPRKTIWYKKADVCVKRRLFKISFSLISYLFVFLKLSVSSRL